jgi:head-tail adaptor
MPFGGTDNPWPSIDPGQFRHLITFLEQDLVQDGSGVSPQWNPAEQSPVWMKVEYMRGTDKFKAGQNVAQALVTLTGYWRPWFSTDMRVQLRNGSQFIIQSIENVLEMNTFAVLTCVGLGSNT